jgi:CRISPR-associated endoribonuclease Cas6
VLNEAKLTIANQDDLHYNMGAVLHGYLMEQAETDYVEKLHQSGLNPFSQSLYYDRFNQAWVWKIATLNEEAYQQLIVPLLTKEQVKLDHHQKTLRIKNIEKKPADSYEALTRQFYLDDTNEDNNIFIDFSTPCSFKVKGQYLMMPSLFHIYQSLMLRFSAFSTTIDVTDQQVLEHLCDYTHIVDYRLQSSRFMMGKTTIKGFSGSMRLRLAGPQTLKNLARLLFAFGSYSGIGIKTGLGMGAVTIGKLQRLKKEESHAY